jgi:PIN domain nuclease of toxin-antitoxin system
VSDSLLLDTNVLIWLLSASTRISRPARRALSRQGVSLVVSAASVWEIVLKTQAGRLSFRLGLDSVLDQILHRSPWTILPVSGAHLPVVAALPLLHRDPFDRLLIAQAQHENLVIVTADQQIPRYDVRTVW